MITITIYLKNNPNPIIIKTNEPNTYNFIISRTPGKVPFQIEIDNGNEFFVIPDEIASVLKTGSLDDPKE